MKTVYILMEVRDLDSKKKLTEEWIEKGSAATLSTIFYSQLSSFLLFFLACLLACDCRGGGGEG